MDSRSLESDSDSSGHNAEPQPRRLRTAPEECDDFHSNDDFEGNVSAREGGDLSNPESDWLEPGAEEAGSEEAGSEDLDEFHSSDDFRENNSPREGGNSNESESDGQYSGNGSDPNPFGSDGENEDHVELPGEHLNEENGIDQQGSDTDGNEEHALNDRRVLLADTLCPCTRTTEGDALLMCLALGIRHNLTWVAMIDILKMINELYGREVVSASQYFFMKYFDESKDTLVVHLYCPKCEKYLGSKDDVNQQEILQCCGEDIRRTGPGASFFVSVKLRPQLKKLMETPEIAEEITTYRFMRTKKNNDALEDIYDGEGYKKYSAPGQLLSNPNNFSFTMNTDGMALGDSTSRSAWPIFLYINELSPKNRKKHVIFAGVWVDKKQPNMRIFLRPFINEMQQMSNEGFVWKDAAGQEQTSRVIPLIAVLDSGARYKFLNLISFSGYYGCTLCYQKAEHTVKGRRFTVANETAPLRTQESMIRDMRIAHNNRNQGNRISRIYKGCRGMTPLVLLHPYLDLGSGVIVDFMHNALLGVTRSNTAQLLQTATAPYYIGAPEKLHVLNSRLQRIKPPTSISRTPRPLKEAKIWHANEWRSFLIFYGLPCYDRALQFKYLEHFAMLSSAFNILLQDSITADELNLADRYLKQYVYLTERYYGKLSMKYNIHLLLHVIDAIRNWGPVWGPNTFIFEGENRYLGQMHTSPGIIALQLARRYQIFSSFPKYCEMYASTERPVNFIREITGRNLKSFFRSGETVLIGRGVTHILSAELNILLRNEGIIPTQQNVLSFNKMIHRSIRYTTASYSESKKTDDSWIKLTNNVRGRIQNIFLVDSNERQIVALVIQTVNVDREPVIKTDLVTVTHLKKVIDLGLSRIVKPLDICQQCIYMDLDNGKFIVDIPYGCYGD